MKIETPDGHVRGRLQDGVARFLGIPYARPPIGAARLRAPAPPAPWAGVREATRPGPASLQSLGGHHLWLNDPIERMSEDCLYLNVWTPGTTGRHPVLVWLHGGQTRFGHGAAAAFDGSALARRGVLVVTVNYRLGALGGLAHPTLEDEHSGTCANWGLQDKLAALAWVRRCIAAFGGDPQCVTLAGQSSGAANAALMVQHGLGEGCYQRAILQSPPLFRPPMFVDLAEAAEYTEAFAASLGTTPRELRALDGEVLQAAERRFAQTPAVLQRMGRPRTAPVRDGVLLRQWTYDAPAAAVPVLMGWTRTESDFWFALDDGAGRVLSPGKPPQSAEELARRVAALQAQHDVFETRVALPTILQAYDAPPEEAWRAIYTDLVFRAPIVQLLNKQAAAGRPAWAYEFGYPTPSAGGGSPHAADVPFVFGTVGHPHFAASIGTDRAAAQLSQAMVGAWADFTAQGKASWPRWNAAHPQLMRFDREGASVGDLAAQRLRACWPAYCV
jgi:para-nitrobenzyl esterase